MERVNIDYFFKEPRRFPWEIMGLTSPQAGPPHIYICLALAPYVDEDHKSFFKGSPALFELRRYSQNSSLATDIVEHCDREERDGVSTARTVLSFLKKTSSFRDSFQVKIEKMLRDGVISLPKDCMSWMY